MKCFFLSKTFVTIAPQKQLFNGFNALTSKCAGEAEQGGQEGHLPLQFLQSLHRIIIFLHINMSWYHILLLQILAAYSIPGVSNSLQLLILLE